MERKKIHDILDTKDKERISIKRCIEFQNKDENRTTILAFSGGKDSVVAYMMAAKSGIKFIPMYSPTSVDPPELINYIKNNSVQRKLLSKDNIIITKTSFLNSFIEDYSNLSSDRPSSETDEVIKQFIHFNKEKITDSFINSLPI